MTAFGGRGVRIQNIGNDAAGNSNTARQASGTRYFLKL